MKNNVSSIFIDRVTMIDYAFIDKYGCIVGDSASISVRLSGSLDKKEQVVVDFGKAKKEIKRLIDDPSIGLDHKLWIIKGYSEAEVKERDDSYHIESNSFQAILPKDCVCFVSSSYASQSVKEFLKDNIPFKCELEVSHNYDFSRPCHVIYDYVHGLKYSSHYGCQNACHGHFSYIVFSESFPLMLYEKENQVQIHQEKMEKFRIKLEKDLRTSVFISSDNIVEENNGYLTIAYTAERGKFWCRYKMSDYNIHVLNTEPTIENMVEWFCNKYRNELKELEIEKVLMSEGLSKGAEKILFPE